MATCAQMSAAVMPKASSGSLPAANAARKAPVNSIIAPVNFWVATPSFERPFLPVQPYILSVSSVKKYDITPFPR